MNGLTIAQTELTDVEFETISQLVKRLAGINLHNGKRELVKARLAKRLRRLNLHCFQDYIEYVRSDSTGNELTAMLDALCTNLTQFFREQVHFSYLQEKVLPAVIARTAAGSRHRLRIWSAGCATGEEAYSIAMTVAEATGNSPGWDVGILATDLSSAACQIACRGEYEQRRVSQVPIQLISKYFDPVVGSSPRRYRVGNQLRRMLCFARLNLMDLWPMRGPMDAIFCRNVMIYFDKPTQVQLVGRLRDLLAPGGTLFIGHSESLAGLRQGFRYVEPTIYEKM